MTNHELDQLEKDARRPDRGAKYFKPAAVLALIEINRRLKNALAFYANPNNWRISHDKDGNLLWVTSLGPDYALEILNNIESKQCDGTLTVKK